jgi:hypothetical protein
MKHDIKLPLTRRQFDRLKEYNDLDVALKNELPKSKVERIAACLRDPDYELHLVRPSKGTSAYLRLRLGKPRIFVPMPHALSRPLHKCASQLGITANQFIKLAIKSRLDALDKCGELPELKRP